MVMLLFWILKIEAQEIQFSQFYASPLYLSPSFAGDTRGTRITANYRDQWPQIPNAYVTYSFGIDHCFPDYRSGLGLQFMRDQQGEVDLNTSYYSIHYSYDIFASKKIHVRPGLQIIYVSNSVDYSKIILRNNQNQLVNESSLPGATPDFTPYNYVDLATSILAYTNKYWFGTKFGHLMRPEQISNGSVRMPINIDVYGGVTLRFYNRLNKLNDDNIKLAFNYLSDANFNQFELGFMGLKNGIQLGIWYRGIPALKQNPGSDAIILSIGYIYDNLSFNYSHDFTISGLSSSSNGADEILLIYLFNQYQNIKKKRAAIKCPKFR